MIRRALSLLFLLSGAMFAQTTTTYTVTSPSSDVYGYPYRFFSIPLSDAAQVNWLEIGYNTACANQASPAVGFIYLTLPGHAFPCAPLIGTPASNQGSFQGVDSDGTVFSGTYSLSISVVRHCGGSGRGGSCHTVATVNSGTVTVTE